MIIFWIIPIAFFLDLQRVENSFFFTLTNNFFTLLLFHLTITFCAIFFFLWSLLRVCSSFTIIIIYKVTLKFILRRASILYFLISILSFFSFLLYFSLFFMFVFIKSFWLVFMHPISISIGILFLLRWIFFLLKILISHTWVEIIALLILLGHTKSYSVKPRNWALLEAALVLLKCLVRGLAKATRDPMVIH